VFLQLKVTLQGVEPPIWRRIVVSDSVSLYELHRTLQIVMGWEDCHLHDFSIGRVRYAVPSRDDWGQAEDETRTTLSDVLRPKKKLLYQYDFGDSWMHEIVLEKALEEAPAATTVLHGRGQSVSARGLRRALGLRREAGNSRRPRARGARRDHGVDRRSIRSGGIQRRRDQRAPREAGRQAQQPSTRIAVSR
jgi:hypothetical protein